MNTVPRILVVDDEAAFCELCAGWLAAAGYQVESAGTLADAQSTLVSFDADLVLLDLSMPPSYDPADTLAQMTRLGTRPIIVLTGHAQRELALQATARGAWDFLAKPVDPELLAVVIRRALAQRHLTQALQRLQQPDTGQILARLVGVSESIQATRTLIARIAPTDVPVLITGPSGTGKEVISRMLHDLSERRHGAFVSVHCGAIPADLLESELFGYKRGAFTGADKDRIGLLSLADGGTLFLDEIGEMPLPMQVKLLRVLQEGTFYPVGGREQVRIDVRLVSATNADLPGRVAQGQFREDLYYRIKGITLHTTPLDDRTEDIALLCEHILEHWSERPGALRARLRLSPEARQWFVEHRWPGNVRELRNTLESVAAVCQGDLITPDDIRLLYPDEAPAPHAPLPGLGAGTLDDQVRALEIRLIRNALAAHQGNRSQAARALGLSRQGLLKKLARYGLIDYIGLS